MNESKCIDLENRYYEDGIEIIAYNDNYLQITLSNESTVESFLQLMKSVPNYKNRTIKKISEHLYIPIEAIINWIGDHEWKIVYRNDDVIDITNENFYDELEIIKIRIEVNEEKRYGFRLNQLINTLSSLHSISKQELINDIWNYWKKKD